MLVFGMKPLRQFDHARSRRFSVLLGILIVGLFATLQAVHAHPLGQADDSHCSICMVAHAPAALAALPILPVLAVAPARESPAEPQFPHIVVSAPVSIRPPPVTA
jgi:hypothetical protein